SPEKKTSRGRRRDTPALQDGWSEAIPINVDAWGDGYRFAPPILVSARPAKVRAFRKEWPRPGWPPGPGRRSLDRNPSKHCELIFEQDHDRHLRRGPHC